MLQARDLFPSGEAGAESGKRYPHWLRILRRTSLGRLSDSDLDEIGALCGMSESMDKAQGASGGYIYPLDH